MDFNLKGFITILMGRLEMQLNLNETLKNVSIIHVRRLEVKSGLRSVSCLHRSEARGKKMAALKGRKVLVVFGGLCVCVCGGGLAL